MFGKKGYTKSFKKAFESIDKFIDIEGIYDDCIMLKDKSILKAIKLSPIDIWTTQDAFARQVLQTLRYSFNQFYFQIYQAFVYSPSSFQEITNSLIRDLDNADNIQSQLIIDEIEKMEMFTSQNKKVEFFLMIKCKNARELKRNYSQLVTELSRVFYTKECTYLDYNTYINWLFDFDNNFISMAYYKGQSLVSDDMSEEEYKEKINEIDIKINQELQNNKNDIYYKLFDIDESDEYFRINGKYYCVLLIKAFPHRFDVGILNYIGRNQNVKTFFMTKESELDLIVHMRKENRELKEKLRIAYATNDTVTQEELKNKIASLRNYSDEMVRNRDRTLDMSMALVVSHHDYKEMIYLKKKLSDELRNINFTVFSPKKLQLSLFRYFNPIFTNDGLITDTLEFEIGFPMSTTSFALAYPYHFSTNEDIGGFLYGYEINMNGRILFNPWLYLDNEELSVVENRLTGNIILLGDTGSGKSTDLYLLFRYLRRRNNFIMWIDPENKNRRETINNGGTYLEFGNKQHMFNLFQLTRVSVDYDDDDEISKEEIHEIMWDSEMAIINAIDTLKNVLLLYNSNISDNTLCVVGEVAITMYEKFGFLDYTDENGNTIKAKYPQFKDLKNEDYPTMSDFARTVLEIRGEYTDLNEDEFAKACTDLVLKINPMVNEHKYMFDGHTTVDIELRPGNVIGIGTKKLYTLQDNVRNAIHYIIYRQAFNYCLDDEILSAFIYDEAHTTMNNPNIISLLEQFTRRNRKYKNLNVLATQEPLDFSDGNQKSILNQTTYIIVKLLLKDNALRQLKSMIGIDQRDIDRISTFKRGDSYFICGRKSFFMHTLLTVKEKQSKGNNYTN